MSTQDHARLINYRPEIDGLRALAVATVIIFHALPLALPGGFVGVDVFFVISGYLITSLLAAERARSGRISIAGFYARRVRRIFPVLVVVVMTTLAATVVVVEDTWAIHEVANSASSSFLFVANGYFQVTTGGYFDPATERRPLLHLWSLGVEEQFYLVWPLALSMLFIKRPARLVRIVIAATLVSALLAAVLCVLDPNTAFYSMPSRFWELSLGGLIALGAFRKIATLNWTPAGGVGLILCAIALDSGGAAAINVVLAICGAVALISAIHSQASLGIVGRVLHWRPVVFVGLISYSLYLWHWPLLAIARNLIVGEVSAWIRLALCLLAVVLSWLSYRYIETPARRPHSGTGNRRLVGATVLASCALAYLSSVVAAENRPEAADPLVAATQGDSPSDPFSCHLKITSSLQFFPKPGCGRLGSNKPATVIWGDSHAWAMKPFAAAIASRDGNSVLALTRDSCRPALNFDVDRARPRESLTCREFNELAFNAIRPGDTVILVAAWLAQPDKQALMSALEDTVARLFPKAKSILILGPTPSMRDTVPRCIQLHALNACGVGRSDFDAEASYVDGALRKIAARFDNAQYVERASFFCNTEVCPPMKDGYGLYWDAHHVSSTAARAFGASYLAWEN